MEANLLGDFFLFVHVKVLADRFTWWKLECSTYSAKFVEVCVSWFWLHGYLEKKWLIIYVLFRFVKRNQFYYFWWYLHFLALKLFPWCRLVRAAHQKGANIILIQVTNSPIFGISIPSAHFYLSLFASGESIWLICGAKLN